MTNTKTAARTMVSAGLAALVLLALAVIAYGNSDVRVAVAAVLATVGTGLGFLAIAAADNLHAHVLQARADRRSRGA